MLRLLWHPILQAPRIASALAGLALCLLALASAAPAAAEPEATRPSRVQDLAAQVSALDASIEAAVASYAEATGRLAEVKSQIIANKRRQQTTRYELELARAMLSARAVALYKHEESSALDVLLGVADFAEFVDQFALVQRLERGDREILRMIVIRSRELRQTADRLESDRQALADLVERRAQQHAAIRTQLDRRRALLAQARADARRRSRAPAGTEPGQAAPAVRPQQEAVVGGWWPLIKEAARRNGVDARGMYRLMLVESGGSATIVGPGGYIGLFQYAPSTWAGTWNPYRKASLTDGAAQIKATAVALRLGYGPSWWPASYPWAFRGA